MFSNKTYASWRRFALAALAAVAAFTLFYTYIAHAATSLYGPTTATVDSLTNFSSTSFDASGHTNLTLEFDFDAEAIDSGDSLSYGWFDGANYTELGTILGLNESTSSTTDTSTDEIGSVSVSLPSSAQVATLQIQMSQTGFSSGDSVEITNLVLNGDALPTPCSPQFNAAGITNIQNTTTGVTIQ